MKQILYIFILISSIGCTNRDGEIIDLLNTFKKQNADLKAQITALKITADSALIAVVKVNSLQTISDKKIELIQTDLKLLLTQIVSLNSQMTSANVDLEVIKTKIDELQVKCFELVAKVSLLNSSFTIKVDNLTWNLVSPGSCWRVIPNTDSTVLFLSRTNDVLKSTNFGVSFNSTGATFPIVRENLGTFCGGAYSNYNGGQLVIAGMDNGYYMSNNNGSIFDLTGPKGFGCVSESIIALKNGRFIASLGGFLRGIYKSSGNDNQSWTNKWGGEQLDPRNFSQSNNVIFSATTAGILKSTDLGETWNKELPGNIMDVECVNDSLYYIDLNGNFYVSKSTSVNNSKLRFSFPYSDSMDCVYSNQNKILVAVSNNSGIYISNNRGFTWTKYSLPGVGQYKKVSVIKNKIFVTTSNGLYVSVL